MAQTGQRRQSSHVSLHDQLSPRPRVCKLADAVHDVMQQEIFPACRQGIDLHAAELPALSAMARGKCAYVAGYAVFKVVMRELAGVYQDEVLILCFDMIKFDVRESILQECDGNAHHRTDMQYTLGKDRGTTGHTGLRYPKPILLPVFFEVEKLAAWCVDPTRLNNKSFQSLQFAALISAKGLGRNRSLIFCGITRLLLLMLGLRSSQSQLLLPKWPGCSVSL